MKYALATIVMVLMAGAATTSTAKAEADYPYVCEPDDYVCQLDGIGGTEVDTPELMENLYVGATNCKYKRKFRVAHTYKSYAQLLMWKFYEQIVWCYNGTKIQSVARSAYPDKTRSPWSFDSIVSFGNNGQCWTLTCSEAAGGAGAQINIEGHFHACTIAVPILGQYCHNVYPWVQININAQGNWSKSTWQ